VLLGFGDAGVDRGYSVVDVDGHFSKDSTD